MKRGETLKDFNSFLSYIGKFFVGFKCQAPILWGGVLLSIFYAPCISWAGLALQCYKFPYPLNSLYLTPPILLLVHLLR